MVDELHVRAGIDAVPQHFPPLGEAREEIVIHAGDLECFPDHHVPRCLILATTPMPNRYAPVKAVGDRIIEGILVRSRTEPVWDSGLVRNGRH